MLYEVITYGLQKGKFIAPAVPWFFNLLFGNENENWTNADKDRNGAIDRVKEKVKATIENDGKVFIAEAGQSDFTHDVLQLLIKEGISEFKIKSKVIVVQHSFRNEAKDMCTLSKLKWVKEHTTYSHIDDGNTDDKPVSYNFV